MTGKAFTAVFRDVTTDEASEIGAHPKWSAGSWSHALDDRDAALAKASSAEKALANLLAVIHRDGGHYQQEHGTDKAAADAEAEVIRLRSDLQPVARVTISKPGDSVTGIAFMALNEHGRATLGKGRHELYTHPPGALYTMDQMRDYADSFHRSRVEAQAHVTLAHAPAINGLAGLEGINEQIASDAFLCGAKTVEVYSGTRYVFTSLAAFVSWKRQQEGAQPHVKAPSAPTKPCECRACLKGQTVDTGFGPMPVEMTRMIVCATCGNKRCPHANDHRNECTNSNEPGQPGSAY